ncbi:putative Glucose-methanol-choline oxidoreductase N-terminal domain-containing protein [Seiridium cardinale]|uniref:Glucose-methanol-choline oxidoreductase N-terminal domain-containing protein n=1 Tax=Seiridium cardinale TaxID=138064 RepID=A0ABR2XWF8_9PEZI
MMFLFSKLAILAIIVTTAYTLPTVGCQSRELRASYDFVIVGGGTAGLTVADRLTEALPNRTVLVIEYGEIEDTPAYFEPPGTPQFATQFNYTSPPIAALNNRTVNISVGQTVGGSSATNDQVFDRGSRYDYDQWAVLNGETADIKWDWDGLFPYFKKSVKFFEPSQEAADEYGITWDAEAAYGGSTPIYASYAPFQWPATLVARNSWIEAGVVPREECAAGDKDGVCWVPHSQDPFTANRSHSGLGHYADVIADRPNYDLLTKHKVTRLIFPDVGATANSSTIEVQSLEDGTAFTTTALAEVILSAGTVHTPQILQRSGIGPAHLLDRAGIKVVADLSGVGYNFHDHGGPTFEFNITNNPTPNIDMLSNDPDYLQDAALNYTESPAGGPYTLAFTNTAVYLPLANITSSFSSIASAVREQINNGSFKSYLPAGADASVVKGYEAQLTVLADVFEHPSQPVFEAPFQGPPNYGLLLKPLSRGSILIDPANPDAEPIFNYGTAANPIDLDIMASFVSLIRRVCNTPSMQTMGVVETTPGPQVQTFDEIREWVRDSASASFLHPCCTASMMPRELGGVVGTDLRVHGFDRLRVVDASIIPILPGGHPSATVYAIAEKAADIIVTRWST